MKPRMWFAAALAALALAGCGSEAPSPATPVCGGGTQQCGDACVDTATDPRHCGGCGAACDADELCSDGSCRASCPEGQTLCGGECHDLEASAAHCGGCGAACDAGEVCSSGSCETSCPAGQTACDGGCQDLDESALHCGACGNACAAGERCDGGACVPDCAAGETACGGACSDLSTDRANCGSCGTACGADELCVDGACALGCGGGLEACGDRCTSTAIDPDNCGTCGNACAEGESCQDGTCRPHCGPFASTVCDGACTNTAVDHANCGACGNACAEDQVCNAGICTEGCSGSADVCAGACTDTTHDPANCGSCGTACTAAAHATAVCSDGGCRRICHDGFDDCDGDLESSNSNGCESATDAGITSCGGCGIVCPTLANASVACVSGECAVGACASGYNDCDGALANGCESLASSDRNNCGGCGVTCGDASICSGGSCVPAGPGERCPTAIPITAGLNSVAWSASRVDYLPANPSCGTGFELRGGDIVLRYDATFSGRVQFSLAKANNTQHILVVASGTCGDLSNEVACLNAFVGTSMATTVEVSPGTSYFVYVTDTVLGNAGLGSPLEVTVTETNCAAMGPATATLSPASGTTLTQTVPELQVTFSRAIDPTAGVITLTGNQGTSRTFSLSAPEVELSSDGTTLTIQGGAFAPGEQITASWTNVRDAACLGAIAPPAWTFTAATAPCHPGTGGLVGWQTTRMPSGWVGLSSTADQYVAADANPNGWVYVGNIISLYRTPKQGGMPQAVDDIAGLTGSHLGYAMLVDGDEIYTVESKTSGTSGHLFRITRDAGATWNIQDMALFPRVPGDDFRSAASDGSRIFMITNEGTASVDTEIWSITRAKDTQDAAVLELSFGANAYVSCGALAVDASNFYTVCQASGTWRLLRIPRAGGAPVEVTTLPGNANAQVLHGRDTNADGNFDVLYFQGDREEGHFVCNPGTPTPFTDRLFKFGTGTGNNGMGFDPVANALWAYDDDTSEFVLIH